MQYNVKNLILTTLGSFFLFYFGFLGIDKLEINHLLYQNFILHGVLLLTLCLVCFYIMHRALVSYKYTEKIEVFILALVFCIFGFVFLYHGLAIPGLLFFNEEIFDIFEHTGLFLGAFVSLLLIPDFICYSKKVYLNRKNILTALIAFLVAYPLFILSTPPFVEIISTSINVLTFATAILFGIDVAFLTNKYLQTKSVVLYYLIIGFAILINTGIAPLYYQEWNLMWWYFHLVTLIGYIVILIGLNKSDKYDLIPKAGDEERLKACKIDFNI
jgi:hypothetical protein